MITILSIIILVIAAFLSLEYLFHTRNIRTIPIRIHVNGTRGKSSVTRLIAGALRESGIRAFAKTTGTLPRMIMEDGKEFSIYRPTGANIIEQLRIVSLAARNRAEALVVECMALQPRLQSLTELKVIRATHGVITNARADHLDVMGPTERDVSMSLLGTVPKNGKLFTAEHDYREEFQTVCNDRNTDLTIVEISEYEAVSDEDMQGFSYFEHKENVALVLKVCASLGISKDVALRGMWKAKPDPGSMSEHEISFFGRKIIFINGFAANDPESSERIWTMAVEAHSSMDNKIMIINSRADRPDRSKQLGEALIKWPQADRYLLIGSGVYVLFRQAVSNGMDITKFVYAEGMAVNRIFEEVVGLCGKSAMVMGIGNIGGPGLELVDYFSHRTTMR